MPLPLLALAAPAPRWALRAVIAAVGLVAYLAYMSGAALGIGTSDRDQVFSPADAPWAQSMLPALETPFAVPWSPSSLAARGSIAIALGRRTAVRDLAAVATGLAIVFFGVWLTTAGVPLYSVLFAMLAMGASATFWWRGIYWMPDALSPALALTAAWAGSRWLQAPRITLALIAVIAAALALAEDPSWLACLPAAAVLWWSRLDNASTRIRAIAALAVVAAAATLPVLAKAVVARQLPWAQLLGVEPPFALALWSQHILGMHGSSLRGAVSSISREFTPLGALLILIGLAVLWSVPRHRGSLTALVAGLMGWFWLVPRSGLEIVSVPLAICGWAAVAVALAWLAQSVRPAAGRALVAVVGVLLIAEPGLTRVRLSALGKDRSSEAQARMAYDFRLHDLPANTVIIAESRRVDANLLLLSRRERVPVLIAPQSVEHLRRLADRGRALVAFGHGRAHLERFGFLFERAWIGADQIAVLTGQIPCVALEPGKWPDVSLLLANGFFVLHGATPDAAPGGVILRLTDPQPIRFSSIEPRSIPFEMGPVVHDAAVGIGELDLAASRSGVPQVVTLRIRETGRRNPITFTFASPPQAAVATADGPTPVTLCPGVAHADLTLGRLETARAALRINVAAPFGAGWHSPEADPDPFRWTAAPNASVRISMARPGPVHITVTATPAARVAQHPTLGLVVNDCDLPTRPMPPGQGDYEWDVEPRCWHAGVNQLWLQSSPLVSPASLVGGHDTRLLGARIGTIRLARIPQ